MKYLSLANLLPVALGVSIVGASVAQESRDNYLTVTLRGTMSPEGKFTPATEAQIAEENRQAELARQAAGSTAPLTLEDPQGTLTAQHVQDSLPGPRPMVARRSQSARVLGEKREVAPFHEAGPGSAKDLAKRGIPPLSVLFNPGGLGFLIVLTAINIAMSFITTRTIWHLARENFTMKTTSAMMDLIQANATMAQLAPAAFCYNDAWDADNPDHVVAKVSKKLSLFPLHVTYDCAFLVAPVTVWTRGRDGLVNLAVSYDRTRCAMDKTTADFWCTH